MVLTRRLNELGLVLLGVLPDVRDKVEEAADDRRSFSELTHSVDERALKVGHDSDGPVEHLQAPFIGKPLDQVEEALVNYLSSPPPNSRAGGKRRRWRGPRG